jgi:peptidyl-dipeptidase Dcp
MNTKKIMAMVMASVVLAGCAERNPFFETYDTPYGVPPFAQIKDKHYLPAFKQGMAEQWAEINAIIADTAVPDFDNTIAALERSGALLYRVNTVFQNLYDAESNAEMDKIAEEITPLLSKHRDSIVLSEELFARIKAVYKQEAANKTLSGEDARLLEETYKHFVRGGANLDAAAKQQLSKVNGQLASATLKFQQNTLAETNGYQLVIDNADDLKGLPAGLIETAANDKGQWVFTLKNPSIMGFLQYADNRTLREQILTAYATRANHNNELDNKKVIEQVVKLRLEKARIMGYNTYADYVLDDCMAKNPTNVYQLLGGIWTPALKKAKEEAAEQQALLSTEIAGAKLGAADWRYYAEKIRKQNYALDDEQLRPYFKLENVQQGVFTLMNKLFGLQFELLEVPVYHQDVTCYAVKESTGEMLGLVYLDFFPRNGKRSGAWMTNFREQYYEGDTRILPVVSLVFNFTPPTKNAPALLTLDEAETMFHEFGHATHSLLSDCRYRTLSGTNTTRDYVELPSQILENWAFTPELMSLYARHYQTNELIPNELVEKIERSAQYGQGFITTELIAAALLDMDYHSLANVDALDVEQFEQQAMNKIGLIPEILPRYRSTYFNHVFSGTGYDAGYYSYIWAEVLDADGFMAFKETGDIFNPTVAKAYRTNILERGNTEDPMSLYTKFRGKQPDVKALMERRGL